MNRILTVLFTLSISISTSAAMVRVIDVQDARTLVIERDGKRETLTLDGIVITDEAQATQMLRWTLRDAWILADKGLVYRSPDALFVNRELVVRGYARATQHGIEPESRLVVTYLGELNPPWPSQLSGLPTRTGSGTYRRSPTPRLRKTPPAARPKRAKSRASTAH